MCAYVEIHRADDDPRFGRHSVLRSETDPEKYLLKKVFGFESPAAWETGAAEWTLRSQQKPVNLISVVQVTPDETDLSVKVYLEFPATLFRIPTLQKGAFIQFCEDILAALASLERLGKSHGNLRPELFTWSKNGQVFKLVDNLVEHLSLAEVHKRHSALGEPVWVSPELWECLGDAPVSATLPTSKNDTFAFGLILLLRFVEETRLQEIFDRTNFTFSCAKFEDLLIDCRREVNDPQWDALMAFIWNSLLRIDPVERLGPMEAFQAFQEVKIFLDGRGGNGPRLSKEAEKMHPQVIEALGGNDPANCIFYDPFEFVDPTTVPKHLADPSETPAASDREWHLAGPSVDLEKFLVTPAEHLQEIRDQLSGDYPTHSKKLSADLRRVSLEVNCASKTPVNDVFGSATDEVMAKLGLTTPKCELPMMDITLPLNEASFNDTLDHVEQDSLLYLQSSGFYGCPNLDGEKEDAKLIPQKIPICLIAGAGLEGQMASVVSPKATPPGPSRLSDFLSSLQKEKKARASERDEVRPTVESVSAEPLPPDLLLGTTQPLTVDQPASENNSNFFSPPLLTPKSSQFFMKIPGKSRLNSSLCNDSDYFPPLQKENGQPPSSVPGEPEPSHPLPNPPVDPPLRSVKVIDSFCIIQQLVRKKETEDMPVAQPNAETSLVATQPYPASQQTESTATPLFEASTSLTQIVPKRPGLKQLSVFQYPGCLKSPEGRKSSFKRIREAPSHGAQAKLSLTRGGRFPSKLTIGSTSNAFTDREKDLSNPFPGSIIVDNYYGDPADYSTNPKGVQGKAIGLKVASRASLAEGFENPQALQPKNTAGPGSQYSCHTLTSKDRRESHLSSKGRETWLSRQMDFRKRHVTPFVPVLRAAKNPRKKSSHEAVSESQTLQPASLPTTQTEPCKNPHHSTLLLGRSKKEFFDTELSNLTSGNLSHHPREPIYRTSSEVHPQDHRITPEEDILKRVPHGENEAVLKVDMFLSPQKSPEHFKRATDPSSAALRYFSSKKRSISRQSQSASRQPYAFSHQKSIRNRKEDEAPIEPPNLIAPPVFKSTVPIHQPLSHTTLTKPQPSLANGQRMFSRISLNDHFGDTWSTFTGSSALRSRQQTDVAKKYRQKTRFSRPSELLRAEKIENNYKAGNLMLNIYSGDRKRETEPLLSRGTRTLAQTDDLDTLQFLASGHARNPRGPEVGFQTSGKSGSYLPGRKRLASDFTSSKSSHKSDFRALL